MTQKKPQLEGADIFFSSSKPAPQKTKTERPSEDTTNAEERTETTPQAPSKPVQSPQIPTSNRRVRMAHLACRVPEAYVDLVERLYLERRLAGNPVTKGELLVAALKKTYGDPTQTKRK